ncbi:hypothetical protein AB0M36_18785 [Actinoplanes sp. NPDC051346]|uniref:hypothetical protein n=1 Tax=Actinoplanes sp. NPDC051346 TaxID=3155048 RepID=UPI00341B7EB4
MDDHFPLRPLWDCANCGQAWPCANAKADLTLAYVGNQTALLIFLSLRKWDAFEDFATAGAVPSDLHERFVGWAREDRP